MNSNICFKNEGNKNGIDRKNWMILMTKSAFIGGGKSNDHHKYTSLILFIWRASNSLIIKYIDEKYLSIVIVLFGFHCI